MQAARGTPVAQADGTNRIEVEPAPPRRTPWLIATAVLVIVADVLSKVAVVAQLSDRAPVHVLGSFLQLTVTRNPGAAFGIGTGSTLVFTGVALAVIAVIARSARRLRSRSWAITLGLLLGGAIGNLSDRIFRAPAPLRGHVVDWIELPHWPVFNLADSAIVVGGVLAVLLSLAGRDLDGTRAS